jgi:hypothetical protein
MGEIKSAAEIAKEKLEAIGEVTEEERLQWKYQPEGEKLAARYIKENVDIAAELNKHDAKVKDYVVSGMTDILMRNISLPRSEQLVKSNKKAMDGLKAIKKDKAAVENVFGKIRHILDHYTEQGEQQKKQAYESLKAEFNAKVQQAIKQQTGVETSMNIDVERQPQFQEEWRRMEAQLESQYLNLLDEYKQELAAIS